MSTLTAAHTPEASRHLLSTSAITVLLALCAVLSIVGIFVHADVVVIVAGLLVAGLVNVLSTRQASTIE